MEAIKNVRGSINSSCGSAEPCKLIIYSAVGALVARQLYITLNSGTMTEDAKKIAFRLARKIPAVKRHIEKEMASTRKNFDDTFRPYLGKNPLRALPADSSTAGEVMQEVQEIAASMNTDYAQGWCSGTVYNDSAELAYMLQKVHGYFQWANPLHIEAFGGCKKMEAEVVAMCLSMYNGYEGCCGTMTSGGSESIIMALKAYRDRARELQGITNPHVITALSVHPAFDKGCHYFGIRISHVGVDEDGRIDMQEVRRLISRNTIAIVGSCPSYPHGVLDDIPALSELALQYKIGLHVDCCLGGFLVPFMDEAGYPLPPFDFRLKGVTSISCDTHKYGFASKGSSVVMYSNEQLRRYQYFSYSSWSGGLYGSPTIAGSRPGAVIAETWAAMVYMGRSGYVKTTKAIIKATHEFHEGVQKIPGLKIVGKPEVSVVAFTSDEFDIYIYADRLSKKGWHLNALQFPSAIHLAVTLIHTKPGIMDKLISDMAEEANRCMAEPKAKATGSAAIYGTTQTVPDRSMVDMALDLVWDAYYSVTLDE